MGLMLVYFYMLRREEKKQQQLDKDTFLFTLGEEKDKHNYSKKIKFLDD